MCALIRQYDKRTGKTYFYNQEKIIDPETGKVKYKRSIAGKLGPDGSMVPTGKIGRPVGSTKDVLNKELLEEKEHYKALYEEYHRKWLAESKRADGSPTVFNNKLQELTFLVEEQAEKIAQIESMLSAMKKNQRMLLARIKNLKD